MFKKICSRCGKKIKKGFDFCPHCGYDLRTEREQKNYGLLGKEDNLDFDNFIPNSLFNMPMEKLFKGTMKILEKQMRKLSEEQKETTNQFKTPNFQLFINGKKVNLSNTMQPKIKQKTHRKKEIKIIPQEISKKRIKEISKLPKKEAETKVRRLSDKIVYEIKMPGVKSKKDIIINKLENSIEIKGFSKTTLFFKIIPMNLPILDYSLKKDALVLELKP